MTHPASLTHSEGDRPLKHMLGPLSAKAPTPQTDPRASAPAACESPPPALDLAPLLSPAPIISRGLPPHPLLNPTGASCPDGPLRAVSHARFPGRCIEVM
jgi:hypothetical protein